LFKIAICDVKSDFSPRAEPIAICDRSTTQLEVPIWHFKFSNFPAPKPGVGDPVMRSQFVTGWLPESRPHFATLNNGENPVPDGRKAAEGRRSPKRGAITSDFRPARSVMQCASPSAFAARRRLALSKWTLEWLHPAGVAPNSIRC